MKTKNSMKKDELNQTIEKQLGEKLGENEKKILEIISKNIHTTVKELSQDIGISETAIEII